MAKRAGRLSSPATPPWHPALTPCLLRLLRPSALALRSQSKVCLRRDRGAGFFMRGLAFGRPPARLRLAFAQVPPSGRTPPRRYVWIFKSSAKNQMPRAGCLLSPAAPGVFPCRQNTGNSYRTGRTPSVRLAGVARAVKKQVPPSARAGAGARGASGHAPLRPGKAKNTLAFFRRKTTAAAAPCFWESGLRGFLGL